MNDYQLNLLYQACFGTLMLVNLVFNFLALAQARRRRKRDYPKWLVPFIIGNALQFLLWAVSTFRYFLWSRPAAVLDYGIAWGTFVPVIAIVYGSFTLWRVLRQKEPAAPQASGSIWPPPPRETGPPEA